MKECKRCRRTDVEFPSKGKGRLGGICKGCVKEPRQKYQKDWYAKNKRRHVSAVRKNNIRYLAERREKADALKRNKPCKDCGNSFPPCAMDYDHVDPTNKSGDPSSILRRSWEAYLIEIKKCELVCSNCHRIREFTRRHGRHPVWGFDSLTPG